MVYLLDHIWHQPNPNQTLEERQSSIAELWLNLIPQNHKQKLSVNRQLGRHIYKIKIEPLLVNVPSTQ